VAVNAVPGHKGEVIVKNLLLAGIALVALAAPAAAADMPVKALPPAPIDIWTGGYVGANVGYDWGRDTISSTGAPGSCSTAAANCVTFPNGSSILSARAATFNTSLQRSGMIYGGQAGHNWLVHNMFWTSDGVLGVEVDFQGKSDAKSTTFSSVTADPNFAAFPMNQAYTQQDRINSLGTLRGRAGFLWGPSTLVYGTAGVAWASVKTSVAYLQNENDAPFLTSFGNANQATAEVFGPVVGGGVEWKWTANWSIKAECLYADFGNVTVNTQLIQRNLVLGGIQGTATANSNTHLHDNIARVGVNYRFW
jgi:outer membrane immunogenic protein